MKDLFPMYYTPDEDDFKRLWEGSIIVFDANVLLNLYRYTIKTKDIFMEIMRELSDRIWIPHQAALEYHANRMKVIHEQVDAYQQVRKILNDAGSTLNQQLNDGLKDYSKKHPIIDVNSIKERISSFFESLNQEVNAQEDLHPNYLQNDVIREFLEKHVNNVGTPFSKEQLEAVFKEGEIRYKQKRPPGFRDAADKKDDRKYYRGLTIESQYGDLLVWKQVIEEAKKRNKSAVFVTDDVKDDWWLRVHGKTIGPRFELIDEFMHETNQNFYMYESHRFLENAQKYLDQTVDNEAIQEVQELKESKEKELGENAKLLSDLAWRLSRDRVKTTFPRAYKIKPIVNYVEGEKVLHFNWGVGLILRVKGEGRDQEIQVAFPPPAGIKRLLANTAPLEKYQPKNETT